MRPVFVPKLFFIENIVGWTEPLVVVAKQVSPDLALRPYQFTHSTRIREPVAGYIRDPGCVPIPRDREAPSEALTHYLVFHTPLLDLNRTTQVIAKELPLRGSKE